MAVVTDGSAVLGLGNLGPYAALPVMEGKAALFKRFADIDAWPICLDTQDTDEIVRTVAAIAPGFGGINLEDISAPRCFEVERRLRNIADWSGELEVTVKRLIGAHPERLKPTALDVASLNTQPLRRFEGGNTSATRLLD